MTNEDWEQYKAEFQAMKEKIRLEAYRATGYEWIEVPRTGGNRTIKEQHGLYMQPKDGIDNDHDGLIDEADEKVTTVDGGGSAHNYWLASDLVPCKESNKPWWPKADNPLWRVMADIAVKNGAVAGFYFSNFFDAPHIEHPKFRLVRAAWKAGEIQVA